MSFWQNVEDECLYRGISRKELALTANFSVNTISSGLKRNTMPPADLALRISKALGVPLERLLISDMKNLPATNTITTSSRQKLFNKYISFIEKLDSFDKETTKSILNIIEKIAKVE